MIAIMRHKIVYTPAQRENCFQDSISDEIRGNTISIGISCNHMFNLIHIFFKIRDHKNKELTCFFPNLQKSRISKAVCLLSIEMGETSSPFLTLNKAQIVLSGQLLKSMRLKRTESFVFINPN